MREESWKKGWQKVKEDHKKEQMVKN